MHWNRRTPGQFFYLKPHLREIWSNKDFEHAHRLYLIPWSILLVKRFMRERWISLLEYTTIYIFWVNESDNNMNLIKRSDKIHKFIGDTTRVTLTVNIKMYLYRYLYTWPLLVKTDLTNTLPIPIQSRLGPCLSLSPGRLLTSSQDTSPWLMLRRTTTQFLAVENIPEGITPHWASNPSLAQSPNIGHK